MVTYSRQFLHGPLLILSGFSGADPHIQLAATLLQNMFPVLNVHKVSRGPPASAGGDSRSSDPEIMRLRGRLLLCTQSEGVRFSQLL